jgi:hypothetical protein
LFFNSYKKLFIIIVVILTISSLSLQQNLIEKSFKDSETTKTPSNKISIDPILTVQKRVNNTIAEVNQTIIVDLILTNFGDSVVYDIEVTEKSIDNPEILVKNLFSPIQFPRFEPNEERIVSYTITSQKVTNITLSPTIATFKQENSPTAPIFTSYSQSIFIIIRDKTISQNEVQNNTLLVLSMIVIFYSIILLFRIFFKLSKKSSNNSP